MTRARTLALILAGGTGSRMGALTQARAKPALPFGGVYRLVDFPLSNCANSGIEDVWLIQQYQPYSLEDHLANGRPWDLDRTTGGLLILHPFTGGDEGGFPEGNADALWRHHALIAEFDADVVILLSADAVYTFDYRDLVDAHLAADADVTMVTTRVEDDAGRFGVVTSDGEGRVRSFSYKPEEPESDVVTIEVFVYRPPALLGTLGELAREGDRSDFGDGLLPRLVSDGRAFEHRFHRYWRDLGTLTPTGRPTRTCSAATESTCTTLAGRSVPPVGSGHRRASHHRVPQTTPSYRRPASCQGASSTRSSHPGSWWRRGRCWIRPWCCRTRSSARVRTSSAPSSTPGSRWRATPG
ncbi:MAG: sugar phosphate nucleotidyltransferase [Actinomycetota bacterium]|nr:sugar phosphate nucleotidyltransferase [Actinomycetota bacterium]